MAPRAARGGRAGGTGGRGPGAASSHRAPRDVPRRGSSLLQTASNTRPKGGITATATTGGSTARSARGSELQVATCGAARHEEAGPAEAVSARPERAAGGAAWRSAESRTERGVQRRLAGFVPGAAVLGWGRCALLAPWRSRGTGRWARSSYPDLSVHFSVFSVSKIVRTFL